jgi:hypothetical protein
MTDSTAIQTLPLLFQGTLLNTYGITIPNAKIQLWQTDLDGNYLFPDDASAATNPILSEHAEIVSRFQYFGTDATDDNGNFQFLTFRPGIYTMRPYSHFHFMVWLEEEDSTIGDDPSLVTQFYFRDETPPFPEELQLDVTEVDYSRYSYGSYVNGTIVVGGGEDGTSTTLDASPTQPQGPFYPTTDFFSYSNDLTRALSDATASSGMPAAASVEFPTTPFPTLQTLAPSLKTSEGELTPLPAPTTPLPSPDTKYPTTPFPTLETSSLTPTTKYPTTPFPTEATLLPSIGAPSTDGVTSSMSPTLQPVVPPSVSNDGVLSLRFGQYSVALAVSCIVAQLSTS